jgi:hypothetical protein
MCSANRSKERCERRMKLCISTPIDARIKCGLSTWSIANPD